MELSVEKAFWTSVVFHEDYRDDAALQACADRVRTFAMAPSVGVPRLGLEGPGVFGFETGEVRTTRELIGVAQGGIGWGPAVDWLIGAMEVLQGAVVSGLRNHGSLDPHRVLIQYDGAVQIIGFGIPRLDLVDFLDDPTLLPVTESLRYTAPESLEGTDEDITTDLFVLGLTAAHLATGTPLYTGTDPKTLLAQAADGEARAALETLDPPATVASWLGPMLAPWPDERHARIEVPLEAARACRGKLGGGTLEQAMEAHAELGSSVEVDLPRGWVLPEASLLEAAVDPEAFERARAERVAEAELLLPPLDAALKGVDKALAKLVAPPDWSDTPAAAERRDEAREHGDRAREGGRSAREVVARLKVAPDLETIEELVETLDDAVARARGGAEEGERTARQALDLRTRALEERERADAEATARQQRERALADARASLAGWAAEAAGIAAGLPEAPSLRHPRDPRVIQALEALQAARRDAHNAAEALASVQFDADDDVGAVLQATEVHLQAAHTHQASAGRALVALQQADEAAQKALDAARIAEDAARVKHHADLQHTGTRVRSSHDQVVAAVQRATGLAEGFEQAVASALKALQGRQTILAARLKNWEAMADGADEASDLDDLESLVHTGRAEADFAEADLEDLPALVAEFDAALAGARAELAAHEAERDARQERVALASSAIADAREPIENAEAWSCPEDLDPTQLEALVDALAGPLEQGRTLLAAVDELEFDEDMPALPTVEALEDLAGRLTPIAEEVTSAFTELKAAIAGIRSERMAAAEARQAAIETATAHLAALQALSLPHDAPEPTGDVAVDDRLERERQAVLQANAAFPAVPSVDIEADPGTAIAALETALDQARQAESRRAEVLAAYHERAASVTALVAALVTVCARAEEAADAAAAVAADAARVGEGLAGATAFPEDAEAITSRVEAIEAHAKRASEAAEAAAGADDLATAEARAAEATTATEAARTALKDVEKRAGQLRAKLEAAAAERAAADEVARRAAVASASELLARAQDIEVELEAAIEAAGQVLEGSPSKAARGAWEAAEPAIDRLQKQLTSAASLHQRVGAAKERAGAERALEALRQLIDDAEKAAIQTTEAAHHAAELAELETRANVALHEQLHREATDTGEHLRAIHEHLEFAELHVQTPGVRDALASLHVQLEHAQNAVEAVQQGIHQLDDVGEESARQAAAERVRAQIERVVACRNTATALRTRIEAKLAEAEAADAALLADAQAAVDAIVEESRLLLEGCRTAGALEAARAEPTLAASIATADARIAELEDQVATQVQQAARIADATSGAAASALLRELQQRMKDARAVQVAHEAAVKAVAKGLAAVVAARETERKARIKARLAAIERVREAHRVVCGALGEVEVKLARALVDLPDLALGSELDPVRQEVERLGLFLEGLPSEIGPEGLETAQTVADAAEQGQRQALLVVEAVDEQIEHALVAAVALQGIRGAALAVRKRYEELETQLDAARTGLHAAAEYAPVATASMAHKDAVDQLVELETTLREARTSLDFLNTAADAEEARAQLEVAEASLDIATSLFEFALPMVQAAVDAAEAEAKALVEVEARNQRAREQLAAAIDGLPTAAAGTARLQAARDPLADLVHVRDRAELDAADAALTEVAAAWQTTLAGLLAKPVRTNGLEQLEAEAARRSELRATLTTLDQQLDDALGALVAAGDAVRARETERTERLARVVGSLEKQRTALVGVQADLATRASAASELAATLDTEAIAACATELASVAAELASLVIPPAGDLDLDAALAAQAHADEVLDRARDGRFEALEQQLAALVDDARSARADRTERIEALRGAIGTALEAIGALRADAVAAAAAARDAAGAWPLETEEALNAMDAALATIAAADDPVVPELPDEPTPARVAELTAIAEALVERRRALELTDVPGAAQVVQDAIQDAVAAAEAEREAIAAAHARVAAAAAALTARQAAAAESLLDLAEQLEIPEIAEIAEAFRSSVDAVGELRVDEADLPIELEAAERAAEAAEAVSATPIPFEELAQSVRAAAVGALADREAMRTKVHQANAAIEVRKQTALQLVARYRAEPSSPRLEASLRAIEEGLAQIERAAVELPEDASPDALRAALEDAEFAAQTVQAIDLEGLAEEAEAAVTRSLEEAAQVERERAETQEQASAAVDAALLQLTLEVEARREAVEGFPDTRAGSAAHRSRARDALEAASNILAHLESLKGRLATPVTMTEAVSATFDAESQAEIARQHLDDVDAAVTAARTEVDKLSRITSTVPTLFARIEESAAAVRRVLDERPEPGGEQSRALYDQLDPLGREVEHLAEEAHQCKAALEGATNSFAAETEYTRLGQIAQKMTAQTKQARQLAVDLRDLAEVEQRAATAKRAEAFAEGQQRADLAVERATRAADRVADALTRAAAFSFDPADEEAQALLVRLASANDDAMTAADTAREQASAVAQDLALVERIVEAADRAEAAVTLAQAVEVDLEEHATTWARAVMEREIEAEAERLIARDDAVAELSAELDALRQKLDQATTEAEEPVGFEDGELVRDRAIATLATANEAMHTAMDRLSLLENARVEDVELFIGDTRAGVQGAQIAISAVEAVRLELIDVRAAARVHAAEMQLEEARGRAWEACQLAQKLAKDLTMARNALPEMPQPMPPELRRAADVLAEIERRLWRAGQRADEARERAALSPDLAVALEAADTAETAVGSARRWEKEIDGALDTLSNLLRGPGYSDVVPTPKSARMERLRRGKRSVEPDAPTEMPPEPPAPDITIPPFTPLEESQSGESPTERLLQRLRQGRSQGETGRERLKRLREQRKGDGKELAEDEGTELHVDAGAGDDVPSMGVEEEDEYPSVAEFDDEMETRLATAIKAPPGVAVAGRKDDEPNTEARRKRRAGLLSNMKRRQEDAADEGRTQVFSVGAPKQQEVDHDAATQMFTREMLASLIDGPDADDDTQTGGDPKKE